MPLRQPLAAAVLAVAAASLAACGSTVSFTQATPLSPAASVAQQLSLTGFTDCGEVPAIGASDSGAAYEGSELIDIDIFPSQASRDEWVSTARPGIVREGGRLQGPCAISTVLSAAQCDCDP
jgi:hypothetical protein